MALAHFCLDGNAIHTLCYLCNPGFPFDVMFSHDWRELARIKGDAYVLSNSPGAGTGGAVCRLQLLCLCKLHFAVIILNLQSVYYLNVKCGFFEQCCVKLRGDMCVQKK